MGIMISNRRKMRSAMDTKLPWMDANVSISSAEGTSACSISISTTAGASALSSAKRRVTLNLVAIPPAG